VRIAELTMRLGRGDVVVYCECGDPSCSQSARLKLAAWDELRRDPALFVLAPGHSEPAAGAIIARGPAYWLGRAR
jgi:hypothetical protein